MTPKPLLLADDWLLDLVQDADLPVALVGMEPHKVAQHRIPSCVEVLDRQTVLDGLRTGRFSRLLMGSRPGPFWDRQRPFLSRAWQMRKNFRNESLLCQYQIPKTAIAQGIPLSVVDRSDSSHIAEWDHPLLHACDIYWFRERPVHSNHLLVNTSRRLRRLSNLDKSDLGRELHKVRSISLGLSDVRLPLINPAPKRHDIFFSGTNTSPVRGLACEVLQRLQASGEFQVYLPETALSREAYYQACAESYLVVSPSGLGWDCFRHYESALCASVPVMNYPTIRRYHPLLEGEHGLYYDLEDNGLEKCLRLALANRPRLLEIGQRARTHVLEHHLFSKLLRHMLDAPLSNPSS